MKFVSSGEFEDGDWKFRIIVEYLKREEVFNNVFKSFSISEIESEEKRDVIIIFITFIGDFGIYYCSYCNIFFYDFIMYYFYKSLYSFVDDDFFRCFSCQKYCQDRIEFMFYIVWYVKYLYIIFNYEFFREEYQV